MNIPDGTRYTENSLQQGRFGETGMNSWTTADSYVVDRVALYNDGKMVGRVDDAGIDVNAVIEQKAKELGIDVADIEKVYHICLGENHVGPLGWVDPNSLTSESIEKAMEKSFDEIEETKKANEEVEVDFEVQENNQER